MTGSLFRYFDRPISQNAIPDWPPSDVPGSVRSPLHFPLHLHVVRFVLRRYPGTGRAHLLTADKLVPSQIRCLKITMGPGLFRSATGSDRGNAAALSRSTDGRVSPVECLLEQLLLQKHRLLKVGHVRVHSIRGQVGRIRRTISVIMRTRASFVRLVLCLSVGERGARATEPLLLLLLLLLYSQRFRGAKHQRTLVMIPFTALQFQRERIAVAGFSGVVRARAILLLARAVALRRTVPSSTLIRLVLRILNHRVRRGSIRSSRDGDRDGRDDGRRWRRDGGDGWLCSSDDARSMIRMMPMSVMFIRRRVDRFAVRLRYSLIDVFCFAPHVIRVSVRQPNRDRSSSSASASATCLRLTAYTETLHLLRAILQRLLHPLFAIVIRVSRRRRSVSTGRFLRRLGRTTRRRGVVVCLVSKRVTGHRWRRWRRRPQRRTVLFRVFGPFLRLLLLLPNQLLDQAVLIGR